MLVSYYSLLRFFYACIIGGVFREFRGIAKAPLIFRGNFFSPTLKREINIGAGGGGCYTNESLWAFDLPTIRSTDIRSIRSVDSFLSHPTYDRKIRKIDRMTIISIVNINCHILHNLSCHKSVDLIFLSALNVVVTLSPT